MKRKEPKIKLLDSYEGLKSVARIRSELWPNDGEVALDHMKFVANHGGVILGAYVEDEMVGYVYSFPGYKQRNVYLILQNIGVTAVYQDQKLGELLMQCLQKEAIKMGYQEIIWTFEPLDSRLGYFYLHKLGAVVTEYLENCYENESDQVTIDRFLARWELNNPYHNSRTERDLGQSMVFNDELDLNDKHLLHTLIPLPSDYKTLLLAEKTAWRMKTRSIFRKLCQQGWKIVNVVNERQKYYYIATKKMRR